MVYATQHNEKKSSQLNPIEQRGVGYSTNVLIPINEDKTRKCTCATETSLVSREACSKKGRRHGRSLDLTVKADIQNKHSLSFVLR
jgi:hypothetical protein